MLSKILALIPCLESIKIYMQNIKVIVKRIISRLDHSEYSHPKDIWSLRKRPGIAKTHRPLKMLEPIKVPATASYLLFNAREIDAAISGRLVPIARTVYPMNSWPKLKFSNIKLAPEVISHAATTKAKSDTSNFIKLLLDSVNSSISGTSWLSLYQKNITANKTVNNITEENRANAEKRGDTIQENKTKEVTSESSDVSTKASETRVDEDTDEGMPDETRIEVLTNLANSNNISDEELLEFGDMVKLNQVPRNLRTRLFKLKMDRQKKKNDERRKNFNKKVEEINKNKNTTTAQNQDE